MHIMERKICFGIIIATRGFFNPVFTGSARKDIAALLDRLDCDYVIGAEGDTPHGAVETLSDAKYYADLFRKNADRIDGIIVVLPNFGDELAVVQTLDLARLNVPVLVQACNDELGKFSAQERRDAFCGKLSVCNNLYQYNIPFTDTTLHTCDIDSDIFRADVQRFARVCRTVRGLTRARIGAIGARPAAFQTVRFSEKLLQDAGISVVPVDLSEIFGMAEALDDGAVQVQEKLAAIGEYGTIAPHIGKERILLQAKFSIAVEEWMTANECVASAVQCWTSMQQHYGCASCLTMSMMGERLMPSACEVDVAGTVSMLALLLASGTPPGFLDWNNNFGDNTDLCISQHCSNFPKSFIGTKPELAELDILGETLGHENCFGAVKGKVASGPMTYFRISTDDRRGVIKAYLGQGEFTDDPCNMKGGVAVCRVKGLRRLLGYICSNGFEHHVAMARGHVSDVVAEAVGNYLGWELYHHPR
jgi:L-fucose isomerase-like protein